MMKLRELLFTGMDVPNETRKFLNKFVMTHGMTDSERQAYEKGIEDTLRATRSLLEMHRPVFHAAGYDVIEQLDLDDLIEFVNKIQEG